MSLPAARGRAEQLAVARTLFLEDGVIPFSEVLSNQAAEIFRRLGSPRRRAADVAIGATAARMGSHSDDEECA